MLTQSFPKNMIRYSAYKNGKIYVYLYHLMLQEVKQFWHPYHINGKGKWVKKRKQGQYPDMFTTAWIRKKQMILDFNAFGVVFFLFKLASQKQFIY